MKMMKFILPVIAMGLGTGSCLAGSSTFFVQADNTIPNTVANAFYVDGQGDDWTGAVLRIDLTSGSVYQNASGGNAAPSSAFIGFVPELKFDTYVGIIDDPSAGIAGGAGDLGGGPLSLDAPQISVTWFNTNTTDTGQVQAGNITLSHDATGTISLITSFANSQTLQTGVIESGLIFPEPASLALLGLGGLAVLRRRR